MDTSGLDFSILAPAFVAGAVVLSTHVPLGREVLARGIIFIDLAVAQIAALGIVAAHSLGFGESALAVNGGAVGAALLGALLLNWTERRYPEVQEAVIGAAFVLAATLGILLLAENPHGGERLRELLAGQILWAEFGRVAWVAALYAVVLALWFGARERLGRVGFYLLFAVVVTGSVELVGVYLVFASLIIPALVTRRLSGKRALAVGWALGLAAYGLGLVGSALFDLPSGPLIVWALAALGAIIAPMLGRGPRDSAAHP